MLKRILASVLLVCSVLTAPIWCSGIIFLFSIIYFRYFWEGVLVFFVLDLLYGIELIRFDGYLLVSATLAFLSVVLAEILKQNSRFYIHEK